MGFNHTVERYLSSQDGRLFSLFAGAALLFLVSRTVSRLYFHPLSRFPGPALAALTDYYVSYYVIFKDGAWITQLRALHERYGALRTLRALSCMDRVAVICADL